MRIITQSRQREVFAEKLSDDEFVLSPFSEAQSGRRPINRYDTEQDLLAAANARNCRVTWLTS